MNNLNIKKFPDGFNILPNNSDGEYLMISRKGDKKPFKISVEKLAALLGVAAGDIQRIKAEPAGPLPTPDSANKYMVVTDVGTWTYGGVEVGSNADGYQTTFWWDGSTWSNNGSVRVKGDAGKTVDEYDNTVSYPAGSLVFFGDAIWKSSETTSAGESPITSPNKWGNNPILLGSKEINLRFMLLNELHSISSPTFNNDGIMQQANVTWQDGESGVLTYSNYNNTWMAYDSYSITYKTLTVSQPLVTRDSNGNIINLPLKTIS